MTTNTGQRLLVDAGNTRVKWVWVDAGGAVTTIDAAQQHAEAYAAHELPQDGVVRVLLRLLTLREPVQVVLVHVLGEALSAALRALFAQRRCLFFLVNTEAARYGIRSAYTHPAHLGADRWVALVAAQFIAQARPAIVIDCGTAVTVDALTAEGQHPGGLILPGLDLLSDALLRRTQAPQMASSDFTRPVILAQDTAKGIGSGCLFTLVGAIEGICRRMRKRLSGEPVYILCGGDAVRIHPHLDDHYQLEPALVMTGLWLIAEQGACGHS